MIDFFKNSLEFVEYIFFLPVLYAEIHYRFRFFFSCLFQSEPEIVADIPSRIKQGDPLPILILVKDSDQFPVEIMEISVYHNNNQIFHKRVNKHIHDFFYEILEELDSTLLSPGKNLLNIRVQYKIKGNVKFCYNDNYRATSHHALPIYIARENLPRLLNCIYGDMHCHTIYTSDQVEFGASLNSTSTLAKAMNLDFYCATDHSYDLDDLPDNYLLNDRQLKKWSDFWQNIEELNQRENDFFIIPAEEISVANYTGKNVHCLLYNSKRFFPGSGDSGEKWFRTRSELSIEDLLKKIGEQILIFAAHPREYPPFLQRLLLKRDVWHKEDCFHKRINGLQFINGADARSHIKNKQFWIDLLLSGRRLTGIAGNDAHGNFSRYRQIALPPFTMKEDYHHLFGKWRTGVYINVKDNKIYESQKAIKRGNCFITDGPALQFEALDDRGWQTMGSECHNIKRIKLEVLSSEEFSVIDKIIIKIGIIGKKHENLYIEKIFTKEYLHYKEEFNLPKQDGSGYFRAEVYTKSGYQALSNPIWFES
jgi:hypothetical protein